MDPSNTPQDSNFPTTGEKVFPTPENTPGDAISDPNSPLKQIRTFQGDIADALRSQNESLVSIQRAEQARAESQKRAIEIDETPKDHHGRKIVLFLLGSLILIALGGAGGWFGYQEIVRKMTPPDAPLSPSRLITSTNSHEIDASGLSRLQLIEAVAIASEVELASAQMLHIDTRITETGTNQILTTQNFLEILESKSQGSLTRAFNPIFMLGVLGGEKKSTFMIIPLSSFENAYPGMLAWESTMAEDIGPLFASRILIANNTGELEFKDITLQNKDARILRDQDGQTLLIYSFFDNQTLIITDNEGSLTTIIGRLTSELLSR
jgi:hypothetical protein